MIKDGGDSGMTKGTDKPANAPARTSKATSEKKPRARREPMEHVAVRIAAKDVARIDALAVKHGTTWFKLTRSDMMRKLLLKALDAEDAEDDEPADDDGAVLSVIAKFEGVRIPKIAGRGAA